MIHVGWIVAPGVLAERAEGKLPNRFATSLCLSLHWQVAEAVLNREFLEGRQQQLCPVSGPDQVWPPQCSSFQ